MMFAEQIRIIRQKLFMTQEALATELEVALTTVNRWETGKSKPNLIEFAIGYWQNGIAFMVLALLASPLGLPAVANFLLNRMDHILGFFEGLLC